MPFIPKLGLNSCWELTLSNVRRYYKIRRITFCDECVSPICQQCGFRFFPIYQFPTDLCHVGRSHCLDFLHGGLSRGWAVSDAGDSWYTRIFSPLGLLSMLDRALSSLRALHFCFHIIFWHTITNFCPRLCFFSLFKPVIAPGITAQLRLIIFLSECTDNE